MLRVDQSFTKNNLLKHEKKINSIFLLPLYNLLKCNYSINEIPLRDQINP